MTVHCQALRRDPANARTGVALLVLLAATGLAGCGSQPAASASQAAPLPTWPGLDSADPLLVRLRGPWTPDPIPLTPALIAEIDRVCRGARHDVEGLQLTVVDARGEDLVHAFYLASGKYSTTNCLDMEVNPFGEIEAAGFASSDPEPLPSPGPRDVIIWHHTSEEAPRELDHVAGPVGSEITRLTLVSAEKPPVVASVMNGWFAVTYPGFYFESPYELRGYDAAGALVMVRPYCLRLCPESSAPTPAPAATG